MGDQYHEPANELPQYIRDLTRILVSLKEEVEAIDWYNQRIDLASDEAVKRILRHNQEEEMEHAAMALEYLRRNMPGWDDALRTYLFTEGEITELEEEHHGAGQESASKRVENGADTSAHSDAGGLGIGSLRTQGGSQ